MGRGRFIRCGPAKVSGYGSDRAPWRVVILVVLGNKERFVNAGEVDQGELERVGAGRVLAALVNQAIQHLAEFVMPRQQRFVVVGVLPGLHQRRYGGLVRDDVGLRAWGDFVTAIVGAVIQVIQAAEDRAGAVIAVAVAAICKGFVQAVGSVEAESIKAGVQDIFEGVREGRL